MLFVVYEVLIRRPSLQAVLVSFRNDVPRLDDVRRVAVDDSHVIGIVHFSRKLHLFAHICYAFMSPLIVRV